MVVVDNRFNNRQQPQLHGGGVGLLIQQPQVQQPPHRGGGVGPRIQQPQRQQPQVHGGGVGLLIQQPQRQQLHHGGGVGLLNQQPQVQKPQQQCGQLISQPQRQQPHRGGGGVGLLNQQRQKHQPHVHGGGFGLLDQQPQREQLQLHGGGFGLLNQQPQRQQPHVHGGGFGLLNQQPQRQQPHVHGGGFGLLIQQPQTRRVRLTVAKMQRCFLWSMAMAMLAVQPTSGCSQPPGYVPWSIYNRVQAADMVVWGRVLAKHGLNMPPSTSYTAEVSYGCHIHGDANALTGGFMVTKMGYENPQQCVPHSVDVGSYYFFFLTYGEEEVLIPQDINMQSSVIPDTPENSRDDLVRHDVTSMHLRHPSCTADVNGTHVTFISALDDCGTTVAENYTTNRIIYTNDVFAPLLRTSTDGDDVINRDEEDRWTFNCHYVQGDSVGVGSLFPVPSSNVVILHGDGSFTFSMNLFRSDRFSQPYAQSDFPVEVTVNEDIYFGISVEAAVSGLVLFVENCKATPSPTPSSSTQYYIIQDGCHQDGTLQEFANTSSTSAHYGISAFKFTNESLPFVYLHCDVMVCLGNNRGSRCDQGCVSSRRRRRAADAGVEERATLVQGPVILVPEEISDACTESCHLHATCSPSTRKCVCQPGWVGDGVHCQEFDECTIVSCGAHQRCVNTPGSYVCECVPGFMDVGGVCQAAHAYRSTCRLFARSFSEALDDPKSQEYMDLVEEVVSTTSLAGDFLGVKVIDLRPGSVIVDHVINIRASAAFSPAMTSEEFKVQVKKSNGTALLIDTEGIAITDYDECSDPEKTDCSPQAACLNTEGSFSCSCIMGYQDKSPDEASRPGRVCQPEGASDSWIIPAAAGASAAAAVVLIAIATVMCLRRNKREKQFKDVEGHNNLAFVGATNQPEAVSSAPCRDCDSSL
uniref:ZP domain-containing protein n=1 Tax=Branchiostoma floridae TaxID=7739 RepID=C3ZQZ3_BRAFL|eukprot:XP_002589023.1 hypothetical protein BRAFLDRAFT_87496 [Branchiostoma floridae]